MLNLKTGAISTNATDVKACIYRDDFYHVSYVCVEGNTMIVLFSYLRIAYFFLEFVRIAINICHENFLKSLKRVKIRKIAKIIMLILLVALIVGFGVLVLYSLAPSTCFKTHPAEYL